MNGRLDKAPPGVGDDVAYCAAYLLATCRQATLDNCGRGARGWLLGELPAARGRVIARVEDNPDLVIVLWRDGSEQMVNGGNLVRIEDLHLDILKAEAVDDRRAASARRAEEERLLAASRRAA